MAIDRTGISSLDAGSLDITYSGDEGPKSPKQIAGGEYNRVIELLEIIREGGPLSEEEKIELQQLIKTLTAKGINVEQLMGESRNMRMASTDPILQDEYDKYVFELNEMHPEATPMSIEDFRQQATSGMAEGGIARLGYANGQLVQPGPGRPGYGGRPGGFEETAAAGKSYEAAKAADPQGGAANWQQQALQDHRTQQQNRGEGAKQQKYEAEAKAYQEAEDARIKEEFIQKSKREQDTQLTFREKLEQNQINRNKVLAMRKLGLMPKGLPGLWGNLISGMTGKIPGWAEDMTEEELNEIARTGPYLGSDDARTAKQLESGSELLGRVFEGGPFNTGNMNIGGGGEGGASEWMPEWQRLGYPSYEAWLAAQPGATATTPEPTTPTTPTTPTYPAGWNPLYHIGGGATP